MEVESLKDYLVENEEKLMQTILDGKYRPNPVRRVEIPKKKGTRRLILRISPRLSGVISSPLLFRLT